MKRRIVTVRNVDYHGGMKIFFHDLSSLAENRLTPLVGERRINVACERQDVGGFLVEKL